MPDRMAGYRIHKTSSWSTNLSSIYGRMKTTEKKLELFLLLRDTLPEKWKPFILSQIDSYMKIIEIFSRLEKNKGIGFTSWFWLIRKSVAGHFDSRVCLKISLKASLTL
jgi:hypothetical protein